MCSAQIKKIKKDSVKYCIKYAFINFMRHRMIITKVDYILLLYTKKIKDKLR